MLFNLWTIVIITVDAKESRKFSWWHDANTNKVYFGMSSRALSTNSDFEVEDDATKAQIKKAFTKSLTAKKMNRSILSKFVDLIA